MVDSAICGVLPRGLLPDVNYILPSAAVAALGCKPVGVARKSLSDAEHEFVVLRAR